MNEVSDKPSSGPVLTILRDGYWERSEIILGDDQKKRVRKVSKCNDQSADQVNVLRSEIRYLRSLTGEISKHFPQVLATWDSEAGGEVGYEMPYFEEWRNLTTVIQNDEPRQEWADEMQSDLSVIVFEYLHRPDRDSISLATHVEKKIVEVLTKLELDSECAELIHADQIILNGKPISGPQRSLKKLQSRKRFEAVFSNQPTVRLHGDLFFENILWLDKPPEEQERFILVDPVSVLGVSKGPPLFDLVKYESYASGELNALRHGLVEAGPVDGEHTKGHYHFRIKWEDPKLRSFRMLDLRGTFRKNYIQRYGEVDVAGYRLIDAYFSLAMALYTEGELRWARILKATQALSDAYYRR